MFYGSYSDSPTSALYPFGHGLSYTSFGYDGLEIDASDTASPVTVSITLTNDGDRAGTEVVQLYVSDVVASTARPERQLVGFARVELGRSETRTVTFRVDPSRLAMYDEAMVRVVEPGEFTFFVGASASDVRASQSIVLDGALTNSPITAIVPTQVEIS
jgi:beta-glucosidase